ncbi:MAG TPA: hypothetical protein VNZ22_00610, partial [Bacillota bacterium]|nr:hypothetical protein [Bacillota bacterium]
MKTKIPMLLGMVGVISIQLLGAHSASSPAQAAAAPSSPESPAEPTPFDVGPTGGLFFEDFSSASNSELPAPWQATQTNTWTLAADALQASSAQQQTYSFAYLTNSWSNYAVEARIRFSATNAWGGGIAGRLNPATGSHYAVWVYPEGSPGGSNLLKLIKFQNWTNFSYRGDNSVPMQQVSLSEVGTNWHTLKLVFQTNRITVAYDGTQVISLADWEPLPYQSGAVGFGLWTDQTPFIMSVDEVAVSTAAPPPVALNDGYWLAQNEPLA